MNVKKTLLTTVCDLCLNSFKACEAAASTFPPQPPAAASPAHPAPPGAGGEPQKPPASAFTWKYVHYGFT